MSEFITILQNQSDSLIQKIQNNMASSGTDASGKTSQSFEYRITEDQAKATIEILANAFAGVVETGRKPTPDKKPSQSMIENITQWAGINGLLDGSNTSIVWAIANQINKEGTKLWQAGGRKDIYTLPFEEFIKTLESGILEETVNEFVKIVIKPYGSGYSFNS